MQYRNIKFIEKLESTNTYILNNLASLKEGDVIVTDHQTGGRGQRGNKWESVAGKNLLFSLLLRPAAIIPAEAFLISQIAAMGVKNMLDAYTDGLSVKWPNDIYWNDKKLGGILVENNFVGSSFHSSVIGIGLNVNQKEFTGMAANPISLALIGGRVYDREEILHKIVTAIYVYYNMILSGKAEELRSMYISALYRREGFYSYRDSAGIFEAEIIDIELSGELVLRRKGGEVCKYAFKEVEYVL